MPSLEQWLLSHKFSSPDRDWGIINFDSYSELAQHVTITKSKLNPILWNIFNQLIESFLSLLIKIWRNDKRLVTKTENQMIFFILLEFEFSLICFWRYGQKLIPTACLESFCSYLVYLYGCSCTAHSIWWLTGCNWNDGTKCNPRRNHMKLINLSKS